MVRPDVAIGYGAVRLGAIALFVVVAGVLVCAGWGRGNYAEMQQLRAMNNHRKHIDLNMECSACHIGARDEDQARLPSIHACAQCHKPDGPYPTTPEQLADYIRSGREIPWVRINRLPGHVHFSHVAHVRFGEITCGECHGDMKDPVNSVARPLVSPPDMFACIACHKKRGASVDCLTCHQ